jgi:hypothetical protein
VKTDDVGRLALERLERQLADMAADLRAVRLTYAALQLRGEVGQARRDEEREGAFRAGHRWGFEASEEGWNGECQTRREAEADAYQRAQDYAVKAWRADQGREPGGQ